MAQLSDDGKWMWSGTEWIPVPPSAANKIHQVSTGTSNNKALMTACWILAFSSILSALCCGLPAFILCAIALAQGEQKALTPMILTFILSFLSMVMGMAMLDV